MPSRETWRPVVGYKGLYEVSDCGNVQRIAPWSDGRKTPIRGLLHPNTRKRYARVTLFKKGKRREFAVHRLVLAAFVGPLPKGKEVNHRNGVKQDNRLENLEYVTKSENELHVFRVLGGKTRPGSKHHNARLTEKIVKRIRAAHARGKSAKALAIRFSVSRFTIFDLLSRRTWRHC